jgi:hypothetical protein
VRLRRQHAIAVAIAMSLVAGAESAAAWQARDFESPTGDRARGIAQPADGGTDFALVVGCDGERGDRWRGVTIVQAPEAQPPRLEDPVPGPRPRQRVKITVGSQPTVSDTLELAKPPTGARLYWFPEPSVFVGHMLDAAKSDPAAVVRVDLGLAGGGALELRFPLAGFTDAFASLSKSCRDWQPARRGGPPASS